MVGDVVGDRLLQVADALEHSPAKALFAQVPKEALDHVQPRGAGRCEVAVETRVAFKPRLHFLMLVRGVVVTDEMNLPILGHAAFDQVKKAQPFLVAMFLLTLSDHLAIEDIQRRKQRTGPVALVIALFVRLLS